MRKYNIKQTRQEYWLSPAAKTLNAGKLFLEISEQKDRTLGQKKYNKGYY